MIYETWTLDNIPDREKIRLAFKDVFERTMDRAPAKYQGVLHNYQTAMVPTPSGTFMVTVKATLRKVDTSKKSSRLPIAIRPFERKNIL